MFWDVFLTPFVLGQLGFRRPDLRVGDGELASGKMGGGTMKKVPENFQNIKKLFF